MGEQRSMDAVTAERRAEVAAILDALTRWARRDARAIGLALCGSWAAGRPTMASDVDLIVLSSDRSELALDGTWVRSALGAGATPVRRQEWGPWLTEVRHRTPSGLDVELGIADPGWAATEPVDAGTATVVRDAFVPLHDPERRLTSLVAAVHAD